MKLSTLLSQININAVLNTDMDVSGITADSRVVEAGDIFVALSGIHVNGADFIAVAEKRGAVAVFATQSVPAHVPVIVIPDLHTVLPALAQLIYPSETLEKVAVTGTNGKTSTVFYVQQIMNQLGQLSASFGTIGVRSPVFTQEGHMTTPDSLTLNKTLHTLADKKVRLVALEASSHGLEEKRMQGVMFQAAAFTNLTQDHLDFHKTMDAYFDAKKKLFQQYLKKGGTAVLNADIPEYSVLKDICAQQEIRVLSYGLSGQDLRIVSQKLTASGQDVDICAFGQTYVVHLDIMGDFQLMNILAAVGLCISVGASISDVMAQLPTLHAPEGRLESIGVLPNSARIFVDYAHTPDALERVLTSLRAHTSGRLICLFGCGGNRDTTKRPLMGKIAAQLSDMVYITDDNPRDEEAAPIREQIAAACPQGILVPDRATAIAQAIHHLTAGDILVLAGKGHETGQLIKGVSYAFSDAVEARLALLKEVQTPLWSAQDLRIALKTSVPDSVAAFGVCIDTRFLKTGDMFIALKGDKLDGHAYVYDAVEKGAAVCLVDHFISNVPTDKQIVVDDTLDALDALARFARTRSAATFIGITGSSGKTTTKEMLFYCLSQQGLSHATIGNLNNHIGVPLTLARLPLNAQYAIIEMGMNHTGELMCLSDLVRPDITVITMIGSAHRAFFKSEAEIAQAKSEIFSFQQTGGTAVLNKDGAFYQFLADKAVAADIKHILSFGTADSADFSIVSETSDGKATDVTVSIHGEKTTYQLNFVGPHFVLNSAAVLAAIDAAGASIIQAAHDLSAVYPLAGRGALTPVTLPNGTDIILIDDAYNANPSSVTASLKTLGLTQAGGRKIAVLGDMLELGDSAEALHLGLKQPLEENGIDRIYAVGPFMTQLFHTVRADMQGAVAASPEALIPLLETELQAGDVVLIKSSHGSGLERLVKALKGSC